MADLNEMKINGTDYSIEGSIHKIKLNGKEYTLDGGTAELEAQIEELTAKIEELENSDTGELLQQIADLTARIEDLELGEGDSDIAAVAQIGTKTYMTLTTAIKAAVEGDTIVLLEDIDLGILDATLAVTKAVSIDGQGHKITARGAFHLFTVSANFTLLNVDIDFVAASNTYWMVYAHTVNADITISNSELVSKYGCVFYGYVDGHKFNINENSVLISKQGRTLLLNRVNSTVDIENALLSSGNMNPDEYMSVMHIAAGAPVINLRSGARIDGEAEELQDYLVGYSYAPRGITVGSANANPAIILHGNAIVNGYEVDIYFTMNTIAKDVSYGADYTGVRARKEGDTTVQLWFDDGTV
jgi:hypothetical protein